MQVVILGLRNTEEGLFFCGANVGRVNKMCTVEELISKIMTESEEYLAYIDRK